MSITRLQQARQMYALGQRVAKTMDGSRPGYRGDNAYSGRSRSSGPAGGASSGGNYGGNTNTGSSNGGNRNNDGPSNYHGGGADRIPTTPVSPTLPNNIRVVDTIMTSPNIGATVSTNPMDFREQYRIGNIPYNSSSMYINNPRAVGITQPYMTLGLETQRKNNYIDAMNLRNMDYPGVTGKVPPFFPYSGAINTGINFLSKLVGKSGFEKNKNFFADNVAGKYGYGYSYEDYKRYMKDRLSGKVGAYGNEEQGQNAINARGGDGGGVMDIAVDDTIDDTLTDDELILRYLGAESTLDPIAAGVTTTDELRELMLERAKNIYT